MAGNQSPYFIDCAITAKCNLMCRHCRGIPAGELSSERVKKLIDEIAELQPGWVIIEGGEPLLRSDLFELLQLMLEKKLQIHLITNGMIQDPRILNLKSPNFKVMVSIDGATAQTYEAIRNGANFVKVCESVRTYASRGLLEAINFTVMKSNYQEIPGIFELAEKLGAPRINFIGLKPCHQYEVVLPSPEEYGEAIRLACESAQILGIEFYFDEPFFWAAVKEWGLEVVKPTVNTGIILPSNSACIFGEYLFIDANGDVKPCSFSPLSLGNINEVSLEKIWSEVQTSEFFHEIKDHKARIGYCRNCKYLVECKGCRSRAYTLTGEWVASDPCCPLNKEAIAEREIK